MITKIAQLSLLFWTGAALAQGTVQLVAPNDLANVEGNSSAGEPFNSTSFRFQQVFDASQFAFLGTTNTARINSISFRIDGASTERVLLFFGGGAVVLSTTPRGPDGLSPVFAENLGPDATTVFNGGLSFGGFVQPGAVPQPFRQTLVSTTPYFYNPALGNLLLDVSATLGQQFLPGALDAHATFGDSVSRVFADTEFALSGSTDTLGLVTRFDITIIPEPAPWLLAATALALIFVFRRR